MSKESPLLDFKFVGKIDDPEMIRRDFRKAVLITALAIVSALAVTVVFYLL
ncbi:MAG: hypothetical protein ACFFC7_14820 [Candidatus Hermodarchaeota archaeon]